MKKIIFLLLLVLLGCAKEPLNISLEGETTTNIHSSIDFYCSAEGGKPPYTYEWGEKDCFNQTKCTVLFEKIGKHEITCIVKDKKTSLNKSIIVEVTKIPKKIDNIKLVKMLLVKLLMVSMFLEATILSS